jgi:DNA-directed RNA polymerase subunit RPC12/RpoP
MSREETSSIECPFCGSTQTELFSLFGRQLLTAQYYCRACKTPFERVKGPDVLEDVAEAVRDRRGPLA